MQFEPDEAGDYSLKFYMEREEDPIFLTACVAAASVFHAESFPTPN